MTRSWQVLSLIAVGLALVLIGLLTPALRELAIVVGLFFVFLAGGVSVWDRRGGH
jgi:hypothetical protein